MIAIFLSQSTLDALLPLPSGTGIGDSNKSLDGRAAIEHPFTEEDLAVLTEGGGQLVEELPGDWVYPESEMI